MSENVASVIERKVAEIVDRAGLKDGIEAVDVLWRASGSQRLLRVYIDKPEGVTHADCEAVSEHLSATLDAEDVIAGPAYTLEVSSPGVERKLTRPKDYQRFTGEKVKIILREPLDSKKLWEGVLAGFSDGVITLEFPKGDPVRIPLEQVDRANLKFEW